MLELEVRQYIRLILNLPLRFTALFLIVIIRLFPKSRRKKIHLSLDSTNAKDGTGAQIQRMFAVRSLSLLLGTSYIHSPITNVTIHPLDPFQTILEMRAFLGKLNEKFAFRGDGHLDESPSIDVADFRIGHLILILRRIIKHQAVTVKILNAYSIVDFFPSYYRKCVIELKRDDRSSKNTNRKPKIVIHYRQGVGGFAIYPGMKIPRQIPLSFYLKRTKRIVRYLSTNAEIVIVTDAPMTDLVYSPPQEQIDLWDGTPKFESGQLRIKNLDLEEIFLNEGLRIKVLSGGSPLDALQEMEGSDYLLMSRSSLSYVGALITHPGCQVYYPRGFWHPKLRSWKYL